MLGSRFSSTSGMHDALEAFHQDDDNEHEHEHEHEHLLDAHPINEDQEGGHAGHHDDDDAHNKPHDEEDDDHPQVHDHLHEGRGT
jgi:hypothetical protein